MATAEKRRKKETVSRKTFLKWSCHDDFEFVIDDEDNITKLIRKVCSNYLQQIRVETRK